MEQIQIQGHYSEEAEDSIAVSFGDSHVNLESSDSRADAIAKLEAIGLTGDEIDSVFQRIQDEYNWSFN